MIMKINLRRHRHRHHHNRYLYHRHQIHHHHITRKNQPRERKDSEGGRRRSKNRPTSSQGLFLKKMGGPFFKAKPVGTRLKTDLTISKTARCTPQVAFRPLRNLARPQLTLRCLCKICLSLSAGPALFTASYLHDSRPVTPPCRVHCQC